MYNKWCEYGDDGLIVGRMENGVAIPVEEGLYLDSDSDSD